jgi:ArsR family transcriptional regulator
MCITDLELVLNFTQSKTSRHLIYLKNSNILSTQKVDSWVFYFMVEEVYDFVNKMFNYLNKDSILQKDLETYRILYSNRELAIYKIDNKKWLAEK